MMDPNGSSFIFSRRAFLRGAGALGVISVAGSIGLRLPPAAWAQKAPGAPVPEEKVEETLKRLFGNRPLKDGAGKVKLETPLIAENGAVVPLSVEAKLPMTPANYAKHIYLIADKNRRPMTARFTLTPDSGEAFVGANIRLGATTDVRAVVEMSDGTLYQVKNHVKVTVGGCGG
ncbi:MAG: thiosulfate oxidation carrier protein SoxY [Nitrospirae bacterium]|nr:thiosulfate oxidation carrier protein SoxY [Nitrospirota bacterium]